MIKRIKRDKKENNADVIERVKKDSQEIAALVSGGRSIIRDVFVIDADKAAPEDCIAFKAVGIYYQCIILASLPLVMGRVKYQRGKTTARM